MRKVTLLLLETETLDAAYCRDLFSQRGIDVLFCPNNGTVAYNEIVEKKPTCALLELFMPGMDALSLKTRYDEENPEAKTHFFAAGSQPNDFIENELMRHGFQFYFLKPYDLKYLANWVNRVAQMERPRDTASAYESAVTDILREIGMPAHIKGYRYLKDAVLMVVEKPFLIDSVTKVLYPTIAYRHQTASTRVERTIRHAIETAWRRADLAVLDRYFGGTIDPARGKPTNSEFIAILAESVRIGHHLGQTN